MTLTDPNYTAIMLLVDRSGSMQSIRESAEAGIHEFIVSQAAQTTGRRTIRLAQFDMEYELVHPSVLAKDAPTFTLQPRGSTALLDAMGRSIGEFGAELAALPEDQRPGTVIYAVMTDGAENSSREFTWDTIKAVVEHQESHYGWEILYLGANQDAIATGANLGIRVSRSMTYSASGVGTKAAYNSMHTYVATAATGAPATFTDEDRQAAMATDDDDE